MNIIREINCSNYSDLEKQGVALEDYILLMPVEGKKKKLLLKRTSYQLNSSREVSSIYLPELRNENIDCTLSLCSHLNKISRKEFRGRYLLKSNNGRPFKVNGVLSFEALLEHEDEVIIGSNVLKFKRREHLEDHRIQVNHPILMNKKLIQSELSIMIQGETGTGKTRLAKKIHIASKRTGEFVHVNLASYSPTLIESELFGHQKGAFTGAIKNKLGALASANHGTLFIDEIDSLPYALQTKLLLFLDDQKFTPVGAVEVQKARTRIIFASGRSLIDLVKRGVMREDFYYRITSGHQIDLRPLRDSSLLLEKLLNCFSIDNNISISYRLKEFYKTLPWPGNIRQLMGHLNKKVQLSSGRKLDFDEFDEALISTSCDLTKLSEDHFISMKELKRKYAKLVFYRLGQDLLKSSSSLGITPKTLRTLLDSKVSA